MTDVVFTSDLSKVSPAGLADLYDSVGFGSATTYNSDPAFFAKAFGPGVYGFFAIADDTVIGAARVMSDDHLSTWLAELCVRPEWQKKGIGRALLTQVKERFAHTALYLEALADQVAFFEKMGIAARTQLVACSRASQSGRP